MNIRTTIINFILITVGTLSSIFCFLTAFEIPTSFFLLLPCCIIPTLLFLSLHYKADSGIFVLSLLSYFLLIGLLLLVFRNVIPDAIDSMIYYIRLELMKTNILPRTVLYTPNTQFYAITPFLCLATMFLTGLLILFIERIKLPLFALLITIPLVESGIFYGAVPAYQYFFPYVIFFILCLSTVQFRKKIIPKGHIGILSIVLILCFGLSVSFLHSIEYQRPRKWDTIRDSIILQDYDRLFELLGINIRNPFSNTYGGISAGDLRNLGNKSKSLKTALTVTLPRSESTIYLKGYVGTQYTKNRWSVQSESDYNKRLESFYENSKQLNLSLSPLQLLSIEQTQPYSFSNEMTIVPKTADKNFAYVPYSMLQNDAVHEVQDLYYTPVSRKSYTIPYGTKNGTEPIDPLSLSQYNGYYQLVEDYALLTDFYTQIPTDVNEQLANATSVIKEYAKQNSASYPESILHYFKDSNLFSYTLQPGEQNPNTDFTLYFLNDTHKGYCVHFASSATLLLRSLGIPARYVEGYVIAPSNFSGGHYDENTGNYTIEIPESNAHAWTEYYVKGKGWKVLDPTPSYMNEISQQIENANRSTKEQTSESTEEQTTSSKEEATTESDASTSSPEKDDNSSNTADNQKSFSLIQWLHTLPKEVAFFFYACFFLFLLLVLCLLRRALTLFIRNKKFHGENANQSAIFMLEFLFYLFTIKPPSNAEQEILNERMKPLYDLAKYSQHTLTKEQLTEIENMMLTTRKRIIKQLPLLQRLFHQYFTRRIL